MVDSSQFFNLWDILVNEIFGDITLFIIFTLALVIIISLKANMPYQVSLLLAAIWLFIIVAATSNPLIYTLLLLCIVIFFVMQMRNLFGR